MNNTSAVARRGRRSIGNAGQREGAAVSQVLSVAASGASGDARNRASRRRSHQPARKRLVGGVSLAVCGLLAACGSSSSAGAAKSSSGTNGTAAATNYPTKPIDLIVPYPAGSNPDVHARKLAAIMSQTLGEQINVVDQPGGSGETGTIAVTQAQPDGYTIGYESGPVLEINPRINPGAITGPSSVEPIAQVVSSPLVLFASPSSGISSFQGLLQDAKAHPGAVKMAVGFATDTFSVASQEIENKAGVTFNRVPVGTGKQIISVLNGTAPVGWITAGLAKSYIASGKIKPLLVVANAPLSGISAPTAASLGYDATLPSTASFEFLFAPLKTPTAIVQKLAAAAKAATENSSYGTFMTNSDNVVSYAGPSALKSEMSTVFANLAPVVKKLG